MSLNAHYVDPVPSDRPIAVIGAGVIGASWCALFLAAGHAVRVYDPAPGSAERVRDFVAAAWPSLVAIRPVVDDWQRRLSFHDTVADAVQGAIFVQESLPERPALKEAIYQSMEPALAADAVVATSSSGLLLTDLQCSWHDPSRFILGHPFNPPHLIPLVELLGNERTAPDALDRAEAFYQSVGKVTIRVLKELPGHVANRLQAALWREAIHLVSEGVASVADVDKAVTAGPGLRWAVMGPNQLFHLGGGAGGMAEFCERYADSFHTWWETMGIPRLTDDVRAALVSGVQSAVAGRTVAELAAERDRQLNAILAARSS